MVAEIFIDVFGSINVNAGLVRIELISRQPSDGEPPDRGDARQRVIMSIEGFLAAYGTLNEFADKLISSRKTRLAEVSASGDAPPPLSPNFR